jgi:DNA processing protein
MTAPISSLTAAVRLWSAPGVGAGTVKRLTEAYPTLDEAWAAAMSPLREQHLARAFDALTKPLADEAELVAQWQEGAQVCTVFDATYPARLRRLSDPPVALFMRGVPPADWPQPSVVLVGSRRPTPYGTQMARTLAADLAAAGAIVGSGLAFGIDIVAHRAALEAGGRSWACVPNGIDKPYPQDHQPVVEAILAQQGAIIGEWPPGTVVQTFQFPQRNRILAALADVVVVVEGHGRSGALITADAALELGVEVMAVPGRVGDEMSVAPLKLLRAGATPAIDADSVLAAAGWIRRAKARPDAVPDVAPALKALWLALPAGGSMHVDDLAARTQRDVRDVLSGLLELELSGWVESLPGKLYTRSVRKVAHGA